MIPNTLPGSTIITQDLPLTFTPPATSGPTVMILGQSLDGPSNLPVSINGISDLESFFGPLLYTAQYPSPDGDAGKIGTFSGNTLVKAAREAMLGGATNLLLVRTGGTIATSSTGLFAGTLSLSAVFPGAVYNGASIAYTASAATGTTVTLTQPQVKGPVFSLVFTALTTFETIAGAINGDPRNASFRIGTTQLSTSQNAVTNAGNGTATLGDTGGVLGTNGTLRDDYAGSSKLALYNALTQSGGTFEMISGTVADIVTVAGLYADDCVTATADANATTTSFLTNFAQFCYDESKNSYPMIGVLGLSPLRQVDNTTIAARVNALTNPTQTSFANTDTKKLSLGQFLAGGIQGSSNSVPVDTGAYLSLVAGPDLIFPDVKLGQYVDSGAAVYAGLLSTLPVQRGATNTLMPSALNTTYRLSRAQRNILNAGVGFTGAANALGGSAFVTFSYSSYLSQNPQLTVTSDVSASRRSSVYGQTQHLRIVQAAEKLVEYLAYQFIGQPNSPTTLMAMDSQLQRVLDGMVTAGALNGGKGSGYKYNITPGTSNVGTLGLITITLQLRPAYEITAVITTVAVTQ